jgi:hypothetical protein
MSVVVSVMAFHEKAGRSQVSSVVFSFDKVFLLRSRPLRISAEALISSLHLRGGLACTEFLSCLSRASCFRSWLPGRHRHGSRFAPGNVPACSLCSRTEDFAGYRNMHSICPRAGSRGSCRDHIGGKTCLLTLRETPGKQHSAAGGQNILPVIQFIGDRRTRDLAAGACVPESFAIIAVEGKNIAAGVAGKGDA